jgi:SAM-dependent methyltransferase
MGANLKILGLQAIPRLAKKFNVDVQFPEWSDLFGISPRDFQAYSDKCGKILEDLFQSFKVFWWDIYLNSDIGMERMMLAKDIGLKKDDVVLDVGCGRGYFTVVAAKFSKHMMGLDVMNGFGREGWWKNFKESMEELKLTQVYGVKGDARLIPFKNFSFSVAAAVHSIRNFLDERSIRETVMEMKRVVTEDGKVVIVESLPVAKNKAQEAHLAMFECKGKYSVGELPYFSEEKLLKMFQKPEFKEIEVKIVDYNLSATPPLFYLDASSLKGKDRENAQMEYNLATKMIKEYGEVSTSAIIIKAAK